MKSWRRYLYESTMQGKASAKQGVYQLYLGATPTPRLPHTTPITGPVPLSTNPTLTLAASWH